ncbi:MAG: SocA family protein [Desulfovibrio sp.]|jgi:hypothetical protein|nr:SocA family protein [Desulfovibrio sp.]
MQRFMQDVIEKLGENKFREMTHMIVDMSPLGIIGEHKLRALLWLCDKAMYLNSGKTISGKTYIKGSWGPELRSSHVYTCDANDEEILLNRKSRLFMGEVSEYISLKTPIFMSLSPEEREVIKKIVDKYVSAALGEVLTDARCRAWETTESDKPIPMQAVRADRSREPEPEDCKQAAEVDHRTDLG